jgi:hypothetical protein
VVASFLGLPEAPSTNILLADVQISAQTEDVRKPFLSFSTFGLLGGAAFQPEVSLGVFKADPAD